MWSVFCKVEAIFLSYGFPSEWEHALVQNFDISSVSLSGGWQELPLFAAEPAASNSPTRYWHALSTAGTVFRLDPHLWVMQDWDPQDEVLKIGIYVHVARLPRGPNDYAFEDMMAVVPFLLPPAVLLHTTPFTDKYIFSCTSSVGHHESGKRTIVSLRHDGRWHCQLCRYSDSCKHRPHAVAFIAASGLEHQVLSGTAGALEEYEAADTENTLLMHAATRSDELGRTHSVSYLAIPPPRWCSLPYESSYDAPSLAPTTTTFLLDDTAQCVCSFAYRDVVHHPLYRSAAIKPTTIYGLTKTTAACIELLLCPICRHAHCSLGADLANHGVFNWNDEMLFTHELLNSYTNAFTASETAFSAFCLTVRRMYIDSRWDMEFCSDETFVRVWFAFTQVQTLDSGMWCPTCGTSPAVVIADGISLGTHISKVTGLIQPPTYVDQTSEKVDSISTYRARGLPAITQQDVQSVINKIINLGPSDIIPDMSKLASTYPEVLACIYLYLHNRSKSIHY
ncbi:hypothetical protein PAXINDRAFT_157266 [Paxillus involutus ATCC 200175]|uniref:HMG domain-containing protein n=1 Tax=Paxillus involutus ATCC 200175 TaxID=664439 RepID=A0A0C9SSW1_PAXIN|nr:hypothetical protein PAXINDRAFT_157266 [Paxillus involutus ATCC 200175]